MAFDLSAPDQGIRAGDYLIFTTPGQGGQLDLLLGSLLSGATAAQRRYPLELSATVESRVRETIQLPSGYTGALPAGARGPEGRAAPPSPAAAGRCRKA